MASITKGWLKKREASYDIKSRKEKDQHNRGMVNVSTDPNFALLCIILYSQIWGRDLEFQESTCQKKDGRRNVKLVMISRGGKKRTSIRLA